MNFITGLPKSHRQHYSIWVIVNRMTQSTHILPVKTTHWHEDYAMKNITEVVRIHGVPLSTISNKVSPFNTQFLKSSRKTWVQR